MLKAGFGFGNNSTTKESKAGLGPGNSSTTIESTKQIFVVEKVFQPTQNLVSLNGLKSIFLHS
jgi:hypothetical protein